jgi:adenylylsulfate kinase
MVEDSVHNYVEVFINAPLDVCEDRDVKWLYKKARLWEISHFTGISAPYEEPNSPHIELLTGEETIDESVEKVFRYLEDNDFI